MSENFRLRAALTKAGMLPDDLADRVEVHVKTVGQWLGGRTPYPRHRALVAQALAADELELWPEAEPTNAAEDPFKELAGAWPDAAHASVPDWLEMLEAAGERIDLLDPTGHGMLTRRGVVEQLAAKAERGVRVRILIAARESIYLTVHDQELGREPDPDGRPVSARGLEDSTQALAPLLNRPRIEVREFVAARPGTILRFDEQMLITLDLYGLDRSEAPLLRLRRRRDGGIFDQLQGHFERIWEHAAEELDLDADTDVDDSDLAEAPQPEQARECDAVGPPTPQQAQQALDRLRSRRRL